MNVVILDYQENFITYLDNDLLDITEHYEIGGIRYIDVEYYMKDITDAKTLFSIGNKIWIQGDTNLTDCLYVINTEVKRDYFKENNVTFTAEDCIVELNYVPFFSQTDVTAANGFTLSTNAGEQNVTVNWKALDYWFGDYFTIGIVQDTLNTDISKITPKGTMTKMELLRYIEEETCNVFIPRYEKDIETNVIHRFLDYLNPNSSDNNWSINWKWTPYTSPSAESSPIGTYDDVTDEDDIVIFPEYTEPVTHNPSDIVFLIKDKNGNPITGLSWNGETDLEMDDDSDMIEVTISYTKPVISASVKNLTSTADTPELTDREYDTSSPTYEFVAIPAGDYTRDETLFSTVTEANTLDSNTVLENGSIFEVYDTETDTLLYRHTLNPTCGNVHSDILDLAYNVENIEYTVNEEDTFTAISPKLTLEEGNTNALTYNDVSTVINNWRNLSVKKGDKIPMIIERMTLEAQPTDNYLAQSTVDGNYYARPLKPNDDATNDKYEYWKATAYWNAPFTKVAGEMFIEDRELTGVEYNHIITKPDTTGLYGVCGTPKMGIVETSDENKYAIYNDVAMKLKDKRFPSVDIEVDVANYKNGKYNDYGIYDKVFVKIPGFDGLVTAIVSETTKKAHDIGENTVKLTNFSIGTKVATKETMLIGDNVSLKYPKKGSLSVTLKDISGVTDTPLSNKLLNMVLYKADDHGNYNYRGTYTKTTNTNGVGTLAINLNPGDYYVSVTFPGDIEYSSTTTDYKVNISGTLETSKTTDTTSKTTTSTTTKTRYYDKYGRSPDKKYIRAIGRASASGELSKYGYGFYTVEFVRKCPHCGSTELYWGIFWAGNETSNWGKFPGTGKREGGSAEGHIFCKKCDADWSIFGKDHGTGRTKNLTVHKKAEKSKKTDAYDLKKGKLKYDTIKITTKSTKNSKQTTSHTPVGTVDKKVKEWALKQIGSSTGAAAAKKLAQAVGALPYRSYRNFKTKPSQVINKGGNCCDQARLYLMACDAVGVSTEYTLKYVYVCCNHTSYPGCGHVFTRLEHKTNGKAVYVDPTHKPWWNTHLTGWGSTPGRTKNYPKSPI